MSALDLISLGYEPITRPYRPGERWMLDAARKQLGSIPHAVAPEDPAQPEHLTIFRKEAIKQEGEE